MSEKPEISYLESLLKLMKREGLTYLELDGIKLVRDPRLEETPAPRQVERSTKEIFSGREPPSNYTNPDLYTGGEVPYLENYTNQSGEGDDRRRGSMK